MPRTLVTALVALAACLALAGSAFAKDGDVLVRGACTAGSTAKLKLSDEDGRIEVELEVDQNRNGVRWNVVVSRNGQPVARTTAVTGGRSGSFEVRRVIANGSGADRVSAVATRAGVERCTVAATF